MLASKSVFICECIDRLDGLLVFFRKPEDDLNSCEDLEVLALKARLKRLLYSGEAVFCCLKDYRRCSSRISCSISVPLMIFSALFRSVLWDLLSSVSRRLFPSRSTDAARIMVRRS